MKKSMRKVLSLLLMAVMVFAMTADVFATEDTHTITINGNTGHSYSAYQVFKGDIHDKKLSNIQWGSGVNVSGSNNLLTELQKIDAYSKCKTAEDVAKILQGFEDDSEQLNAFAEIVGKNLNTTSATSVETKGENGKSTYKMSVTGDGYYFVKDTSNKVPDGDTRSKYMMNITDSFSIDAKDSVVTSEKKIKDKNDTSGEVTGWQDSADYDIGDIIPFQLKATLPSNFDAYKSFSLTFHDYEVDGKLALVKDSAQYPITVKVDDTVITEGYTVDTTGGDKNTFKVHFSNLKNVSQAKNNSEITVEYYSELTSAANIGAAGNVNEMYVTYTDDLYNGGESGKTALDKVIVFTYKTVINKVDQDGNPLSGAEFTLEKKVADAWEKVGAAEISSSENGTDDVFTFRGIDDGDYRLVETVVPDGYNEMDDIYFTVSAEHEVLSADPKLISLTGNADGEVFFNVDKANGTLSKNIENRQGLVLPSTGGIGTTIFYIAGLLLVIGAAIVFITKRRMSAGR